MKHTKRTFLIFGLAAAVVVGGTSVAISASTAGKQPASQTSLGAQVHARQSIRDAFALFRRSPRPSDRPHARSGHASVSTAVPTDNSRLAYSGSKGTVYAYMRGANLCLAYKPVSTNAEPVVAGACGEATQASDLGTGLFIPRKTSTGIVEILPDGIANVRITRGDGTEQNLPTSGNAFVYNGPVLTKWSFTGRDGKEHATSIPDVAR